MSGTVARRVRPRPLLWLAAACACLLVGVLALEYHFAVTRERRLAHPDRAIAAARPVHDARPADDASPDPARIQDWTQIVLARPLFSPSRRPASTVVAGPQQPRLSGIVMGPDGRRAIFAGDGDARGIVAGIGQQAGAWQVQAIDQNSVKVIGPDGLHTLTPARDASASGSADGMGTPALPEHPSILDLLRNKRFQFGPQNTQQNGPGLHLPAALQAPPTPPGQAPGRLPFQPLGEANAP